MSEASSRGAWSGGEPCAPWRLGRTLWPAVFVLAAVFAGFELTDIDLWVQDRLFDFERHAWLVDGRAPMPRAFFYTGPKLVIIVLGVTALVVAAGPNRWRQRLGRGRLDRAELAVFVLTLATVPAVVGWAKSVTNVFCPSEIRRYGGAVPYVKVLERYPAHDRPASCGRCFPAGHASGGFALVALAAFARTRRGQLLGLAAGAAVGSAMGLYQMAKGAHYLSHTVVTALAAWIGFCGGMRLVSAWRRRLARPAVGSTRQPKSVGASPS